MQDSKPDPKQAQLERILTSSGFAQSERLSRFLRYVVEESLAGRAGQIKESTIGIDVFGKLPGFDAKADSTVRSEAVKLRARLAAYFASDGAGDPWILTIPKGSYVPVFTERLAAVEPGGTPDGAGGGGPLDENPAGLTSAGLQRAGDDGAQVQTDRGRTRAWAWISAAVAALAVTGGIAFRFNRPSEPARKASETPKRITWDRGLNQDPALSAEGKLLAYASNRGGSGNLDIWIRPVASDAEPLRLSSDPADESEPDISPRGDAVAYRSDRNGGGIYIAPALGGTERLLVNGGRAPKYSPDGNWISYYTGNPRLVHSAMASGKLFVIDAAGAQPPRQLASKFSAAVEPVWSPNGKSVLFLGYPNADFVGHKLDWWIAAADGSSDPRQVGFAEAVRKSWTCAATATGPRAWVGDSVLFATVCRGARGLARIRLKSGRIEGAPERITLGSGGETRPAMSASGSIAYASTQANADIWSFDFNTKSHKRLTETDSQEQYPSISEDGTRLVYVSDRSGNVDVWYRDLKTGEERMIAGGAGLQTYPQIEPDGIHFTYCVLEPDSSDPTGYNHIFWRRRLDGTSTPVKVCDHCAYMGPGPVAGTVLDLGGPPSYVSVRNPGKMEWPRYLEYTGGEVLKATPSPDRRWLAFNVKQKDALVLFVAPFGERPTPEYEWTNLGLGWMPVWSPDGSALYVAAEEVGKAAIERVPFDRRSGKAKGPRERVVMFPGADRRLEPGIDIFRWMAASKDSLVYPASDLSSSIWIMP